MKQLWKKISTAALFGVLLLNVGCSYDSEIDDLKQQVEELKGTVALKADLQKLQSTVDAINGIDFSQYMKTADFKSQLEAAGVAYSKDLGDWLTSDEVRAIVEGYKYQSAEDVKKLIEGLTSNSDVEAIFDRMIKAYDIWGAVQSNVSSAIADALKDAPFMTGESKLSDTQVNQLMAEIAKAFGAEGSDVKKAIDGWLGANFATYMASYEPTDAFIAKLGIGESAVEAVVAEAKDASSEFVAEINKLIAAATNGAVNETKLQEILGGYDTRINALATRVAELEGRIQSIVWVPQTQTEVMYNFIVLSARNTMVLANAKGEKKTVVLSESEKKVVWEVTPKSVLEKVGKENVNVYSSVVTKAEHATWDNVKDIEIDAEAGTITVTLATDKQQNWDDEERPVIALNINVPSSEKDGIGIDFTSNYILVQQASSKEIAAADFSFAAGKEVLPFNHYVYRSHVYTELGKVEFLEGAYVAYDKKDVTENWPSFSENLEVVVTPEKGADKEDLIATTTMDEQLAKKVAKLGTYDFELIAADKDEIGHWIYSPVYTYSICGKKGTEYEGYSINLGRIAFDYKLETVKVEAVAETAKITWVYNTTEYDAKKLVVTGLSAERFNNLLNAATIVAKNADDEEVTVSAVVELGSSPTADTDVMLLNVEFTDNDNVFVEGGEYTFELTSEQDDCNVVLTIPVTVKGAPVLNGLEIAAKEFEFDGKYTYELVSAKDNLTAQLWKKNEQFKDQISKEQFEEMVAYGVANTNKGKATLSVVDGALMVRFTEVDGKVYTPSIKYGTEDFGFAVTTKGVSLSKPVVTLTANEVLLVNGEVIVKSGIDGNVFKIDDKEFTGVYTADKKVDEIVYNVVYNEAKDAPAAEKAQTEALAKMPENARPQFTNNVLSWNNWSALTLLVKVEAKIAGVTVAEQVFNARINDPVAEAIVKDAKADNTLYAGESVNVAKLVNLMAGEKDAFDFDADLNSALGFVSVKYTKNGEWNVLASLAEDGTVTLSENAVEMQSGFSVKADIEYTYRFGTRKATVTVDMKPGTRKK